MKHCSRSVCHLITTSGSHFALTHTHTPPIQRKHYPLSPSHLPFELPFFLSCFCPMRKLSGHQGSLATVPLEERGMKEVGSRNKGWEWWGDEGKKGWRWGGGEQENQPLRECEAGDVCAVICVCVWGGGQNCMNKVWEWGHGACVALAFHACVSKYMKIRRRCHGWVQLNQKQQNKSWFVNLTMFHIRGLPVVWHQQPMSMFISTLDCPCFTLCVVSVGE